jgi:NTE family protein
MGFILMNTVKESLHGMVRKLVKRRPGIFGLFSALLISFFAAGCAHYRVNQPLKEYDPDTGYRAKNMRAAGKSDDMLLFLTFSGGGTRAAAFSYGVLEGLENTEVRIGGKNRRLLDEVDTISSVSGGSFTAGYYGLFGDRIFRDFEDKFLKKNVQADLYRSIFLNPVNWFRLSSPYFDRSDLAAEYYDKNIFEGGTIGDIAARKGPMIIINATDMTYGIRVGFTQDIFDVICSDLSNFPVARAVAASSAVPVALSPITVRNYAGTCNYKMPEPLASVLRESDFTERQFYLANNMTPYLDAGKKPYLHLLDGGIADNLGLRAIIDRIIFRGDFWKTIRNTHHENVRKVIFIVVNAETHPDSSWDRSEAPRHLPLCLSHIHPLPLSDTMWKP